MLRIEDEVERERLKRWWPTAWRRKASRAGRLHPAHRRGRRRARTRFSPTSATLRRLWDQIAAQIQTVGAPSVIYEDLSLAIRTLRDLVNPRIEKIRIDSARELPEDHFLRRRIDAGDFRSPRTLPGRATDLPISTASRTKSESPGRKVLLKSGGYLIVDPTEAMTTIDVNTGAFVGHRNLEETIFKTNLEAATAIARQLRLRNLGGIIIIDFIDMEDEEHRRQVLRTLEEATGARPREDQHHRHHRVGPGADDPQAHRESLVQILCEPCPCCQGRGMLKTAETTCYEIFREILREARAYQADSYLVLANQKVVDRLLDEESGNVADLEAFIGPHHQVPGRGDVLAGSNMTWSCSEAYG
ncbi:ribonuclease E/G [Pseudomonas aeruginosa]